MSALLDQRSCSNNVVCVQSPVVQRMGRTIQPINTIKTDWVIHSNALSTLWTTGARWTKQPLTLLAQCCFVEAGNIGWIRGWCSGSCTHLCMFNNGGTCFDSDLVPHLNKYWELISKTSGPIFGLNSNCCYQKGSYFLKQTLLDFPLCIISHAVEWSLLIFFFISRFLLCLSSGLPFFSKANFAFIYVVINNFTIYFWYHL